MGAKKEKPAAKLAKAQFGPERPFEIQGQPVALVTCLDCGAAVFVDAKELHAGTHA